MKKIFYILAAAIVALGTVACENEGLDNINPNINVDGDTVSFVAGINRTDLDGTATVWDADDTIVVTWNENNYEFKNAETGDKNTFKCKAEGLSAIVNAESIKAVYSNNQDGNVDSEAGVAGALLEYEGAFGNIAFEVKNAFLKFKANAGSEVKFTASKEIFSTGTELTLTATGEDQYVAVYPKTTTITYALDGVVCTTSEENTLKACKIYPLSNLEKVVVIKTKEDFLTFAEAVNNGTSYEGYTVKLNNNIDLEDAANTLSIVVKNNNINLDLNGKTLTAKNTRTATHNFFFDVNAGGVLTVENGSIVYTHTGTNMGWNGAATAFDVTGGGVLNMNGVNVTVSGTDMNFCVHLNNWGEVTFNADGCKFNATYCGVRVFNSGYDMNNVTIKNSKMTGATRAFWVQMYIGDSLSKPETHPNDARKARLNFDIFGNNNTYELSGEATSPVRYGQTASIYFNPENGNQVLGNATDLSRFAKYVNEGIENYKGKTVEVVKDIDLDGAEWTPVGSIKGGVNKSFRGTFEGNDKIISNFKVNATEGAGFFGAKWDGDIKNVKFNEATITGNHYAGVIVGWADGANYNYNWTVSGCEVDNSTVTIAPELIGEKYDNGDKAGALVGYAYGINVKENTVANTTIQGYRDLGGLVGIAQENTKTTPHSEWAVVTNNSLGEGVKIIVDNNHNYQEYDIQSQYNVQSYVGRISDCSVVENNNGDATIVWGDIPATLVNYVAQVGEDKYETIKDAIAAANAEGASEIVIIDNVDLAEDSLSGFAGTIKGGEDVVLDFSNFPAASNYAFPISGTTTFKDITFKFPAGSSSYLSAGLVGEGEFTFENCAFEGCFTINGKAEWAFNTCEFTNNDYYASFVYAAKEVVFTECSFSGKDRAAKIYGDGGDLYVEYHNCEFTSTTTNKAAIAIDATSANTIVIVDECSQTNMNGLYSLDGTKGVVNPVAKDNNGKLYSSFEAALEASSTIELLANVESTEAIAKECVVEAGEFTFTPTLHEDYKMSKEGTTYTIKARVYVAQVGTTKYESFAEAYAAGTEITLLANVGNVNILKACVINAGKYTINITPGEGFKVTNDGTTWTVAEKQAYRVYVLDNCGWTKKIHAWTSGTNGDVNITGDWNSTSISKSATVNGFSFAYYEFDKNYDGKTVNYIISNNGDDYWRKEYNNIVLNSDKYYRINAVGEIIEINPNDLSTFKFTLYIYDQNSVNASHTLFYATTATGTANAESGGQVGYNWKNYDYFILDGSKIGTDFKVSVKTTVNGSTKTITNLSISKNIKTDLCIGYWNNSGNHGYWANGSSPYTTLLNN